MNTDGVLTEDEFDYWVRAGGHIDDAEEALRAHDAVLRSRLVEETRRADEAERRNLELEAEIPSLRSKAEFFDDAIAERNAAEGVCTKLADALRDLLTRPFPQSAYQSWLRDGNSTAAEMLNNYEERVRAAGAVLAEFAGVGASARSGDNPWSPPTTADPNWQPPVTLTPAPVCPTCGTSRAVNAWCADEWHEAVRKCHVPSCVMRAEHGDTHMDTSGHQWTYTAITPGYARVVDGIAAIPSSIET